MECLFLDFSISYFLTIFYDGQLKPHKDHREGTATLVARRSPGRPMFSHSISLEPQAFQASLILSSRMACWVMEGCLVPIQRCSWYGRVSLWPLLNDPQGTQSATLNKQRRGSRWPGSCTCNRRRNDRMQGHDATIEAADRSCFPTPHKLWEEAAREDPWVKGRAGATAT